MASRPTRPPPDFSGTSTETFETEVRVLGRYRRRCDSPWLRWEQTFRNAELIRRSIQQARQAEIREDIRKNLVHPFQTYRLIFGGGLG